MTVTLGIATVLFNSAAMLEETLPTWSLAAEGSTVDICLVDNSAGSECREQVQRDWRNPGRLLYLTRPDNPGFAAAMNTAVAELGTTHVLLLNPDVWLAPESLGEILLAVQANPDVPLALSTVVDGAEYAGVGLTRTGVFYDLPVRAGTAAPIGPSGGAAVFPRDLFLASGGLDDAMFAWGEDADLAIRLLAADQACHWVPVRLRHQQGHSHAGSAAATSFKTYLLFRNRVWVAARSLTAPAAVPAMLSWFALALVLAPVKLRQGVAGAMVRGLVHGCLGWRRARRASPGPRLGLMAMLRRPGASWTPS